ERISERACKSGGVQRIAARKAQGHEGKMQDYPNIRRGTQEIEPRQMHDDAQADDGRHDSGKIQEGLARRSRSALRLFLGGAVVVGHDILRIGLLQPAVSDLTKKQKPPSVPAGRLPGRVPASSPVESPASATG